MSDKWNQAKAGLELARELARDAARRALEVAQQALESQTSAPRVETPVPSPRAAALQTAPRAALVEPAAEPPVVARLMVEIRSDGSRTIARGAIQDELTGEQVTVEATGNSPIELAGQLAKSLITAPLSLASVRKAWLTTKKP